MLSLLSLFVAGAAAVCIDSTSTNLYVTSYGGTLDSIAVTVTGNKTSLSITDTNCGCSPSPAWLTLDPQERILYCLDEGLFRENGSVSSYQASIDGYLTLKERRVIPSGPSGAVVYGSGTGRTLAISHYNGSSLTLWNTNAVGIISPAEELFFYQNAPGPGPRQVAPHEHEAILDPTGKFIVLPAFGEDQLQIFTIDGSMVMEQEPVQVALGSGPRHGVFWSPAGKNATSPLYFFLLAEITSALTSYEVTYTETSMNFTEVDLTNSYGGAPVPEGNGPAEIEVSPDNRFIVVSNRNGTAMPHASLRFATSVEEYWDTLASFAPQQNGSLVLEQLVPSGGGYPRNFVFNRVGDRVAVGLQSNSRVVIFDRDVASGKFGDILANITVTGEPNCLVWDE